VIDAHLHVWRPGRHGCVWPGPDLPSLHRDFTLDDWRATPGAAAIERVVLVQSQEDPSDTEWLLDLAGRDPAVAAVVGWVDLAQPDAADAVVRLARDPALRGIRPMVQDRPAIWFDAPAIDPALAAMAEAGLVLDALVRPAHLPALARLAGRHPSLAIVIDHAAKPNVHDLTGWTHDMRVLAGHAQVRCKLSGLLTELAPGIAAVAAAPLVRMLLDLFGPDRLIWGSDWPVLTLASDYQSWLDLARAWVPEADHAAVFANTARRTYGLVA